MLATRGSEHRPGSTHDHVRLESLAVGPEIHGEALTHPGGLSNRFGQFCPNPTARLRQGSARRTGRGSGSTEEMSSTGCH